MDYSRLIFDIQVSPSIYKLFNFPQASAPEPVWFECLLVCMFATMATIGGGGNPWISLETPLGTIGKHLWSP
jgi:hypothetical protein